MPPTVPTPSKAIQALYAIADNAYVLEARAKELHGAAEKARSDVLQESLRSLMLSHIASENAAFEADNLKPGKLRRAWNWIRTGPAVKEEE